jgi:glycosyltransferase involved in cell wall biosynthesis
MQMRILIVDNSLDTTGASAALIEIVNELRASGFEFIFVYPKGSKNVRKVKDEGYNAYEMPFIEISKRLKDLILYIPYLLLNSYRLSRIVSKQKISIIHMNDLFNMVGLCSKIFCRNYVITHVRRMPESFPIVIYNIWAKLNVQFSNRILAVSEANRRALPNNSKTEVLYDPLPKREKYGEYTIRQKLSQSVRILYLANFTEGKGQQYGIEIMRMAVERNPDWVFELNFYGGDFGMDKNRLFKRSLEEMALSYGLDSIIHFYDKSEDAERDFKNHDLAFNFSDSESFSRVTLEALYFGVPILATDVGGTKEMFPKEYGKLLSQRSNTNDMYEHFERLILNDDLRIRLAKEGFNFVRSAFDTKLSAQKLKQFYQSKSNINGKQKRISSEQFL